MLVVAWSLAIAGPGDDAKAANTRGMKLYYAKDYAGAAKQFRAAIAADPKYVLAHYNLASMAALLGDKPTVLAELRWLHDSADPEAHAALAKAPTDPDLESVLDDPEIKKLLGTGDCADTCSRDSGKCVDGCGDARGCVRLCSAAEDDCKVGCKLGMSADARARMAAWIAGPLTGRDNGVARMRAANISRNDDPGTYSLHVNNQFGFTCELAWSGDGTPAKASHCVAGEAGWRAEPAEISLRCSFDKKHKVDHCEGAFHLLTQDNFDQDARFELERTLH